MKEKVDVLAMVKEDSKSFKGALVRVRLSVEVYQKRNAKGLSQQDLAKKAETTQKIISEIENGSYNCGLALLDRITQVLQLDFRKVFN